MTRREVSSSGEGGNRTAMVRPRQRGELLMQGLAHVPESPVAGGPWKRFPTRSVSAAAPLARYGSASSANQSPHCQSSQSN